MISKTQFDALAELCRLRKGSKTAQVCERVMTKDESLMDCARELHMNSTSIYKTLRSLRKAAGLCVQAVTGQVQKK